MEQGGRFFILRKRAIENYVHREAVMRIGLKLVAYDDYTDMKELYPPGFAGLIETMSYPEICEMDRYYVDEIEHHELAEIGQELLALPEGN